MAERHVISPRISTTARTLLQQACQERACSQAEVVEAALMAFLTPKDGGGSEDLIMQKLVSLEQALGAMVSLLESFVKPQDAQAKAPAIPIATYEQMYGPIDAAPAPGTEDPGLSAAAAPLPRPRSRLRRWFLREEPS
jgi:hypothetical protein